MSECIPSTGGEAGDRSIRRPAPPRSVGTMPPALDPATLRAVIAHVEQQLAELDRRSGNCALCKSADLRMYLGWLRSLVASRPA